MRKKLKKIYLEITNVCNLKCSFCSPTNRPPLFLSREEFCVILEKIEGQSDVLYLHVMGEPLLHPQLGEFITLASGKGFAVYLTTNGTLLQDKEQELIESSGLERMHISLQSLEQFPLEEQRPRLEKLIASAQKLVSYNKNLLVNLRLWTGDQEEFTSRMGSYLEEIFGMSEGEVMIKLLPSKGIFLAPGIALHLAQTFDWPDLSLPSSGEKGFCMALRDQAAILCNGTVIPCCLDRNGEINLGNILGSSSWEEIMNSPRARNLYEGFSQRKVVEELCRHCSYRKRFG